MTPSSLILLVALGVGYLLQPASAAARYQDIYQPRVPATELAAAQATVNPVAGDSAAIERGKSIYFGKGLCTTCHSKDGTGARFPGHRPRDFTNTKWSRTRTDGELMWVLKHGSPGTGMPRRVGTAITEAEGWDVIHFIRNFSR